MRRFAFFTILVALVGCERTEIHLPATASANPAPGATITKGSSTIVCAHEGAPTTPEEFEGEVELFGHPLKARRQVKLNANGDYVRHGAAVAWFPNGQKAGEMVFRDDKPHGKQHIWYDSGKKKLHGEWQNGLAHGTWIEWHENGAKKSEGAFLAGEKHGKWSYWDESGEPVGVAQFERGEEVDVADQYSRGFRR
jgi:hypothetical protein